MKKGLTIFLFLAFGILVLQFLRTEMEKKVEAKFEAQVGPVIEDMRYYSQLDLGFLDVVHRDLDADLRKNPDLYIASMKEEFRQAVDAYQLSNPWELPIELDIDELLQSMSLEQKIAQLFLFGIHGTTLNEEEKLFLKSSQPGGIIVMGKNVSPLLSGFVDEMQSTQMLAPLFVSIDQEGGQVKRIEESLPGQPYVSIEAVCDVFKTRSRLLHDRGVNLNFGIVADTTEDKQSFIYPRVFQGEVGKKVEEAVRCTHKTLSTIKHFPGHGGTSLDTHQGFASLSLTKSAREEADLQPFLSGIHAGGDLIMMGHLVAEFLDPLFPATLSPTINQFVRDQGFEGLMVTDDMGMISSDGEKLTQLEQALVAGNDLILYVDGTDKQEILEHAIKFMRDGGIGLIDLDQRVRRILEKKQKIIAMDDFIALEMME